MPFFDVNFHNHSPQRHLLLEVVVRLLDLSPTPWYKEQELTKCVVKDLKKRKNVLG